MSKDDEDLDLVLRHIARLLPLQFARAFSPSASSCKVVGWLDTQVASRQRRLDHVLQVEVDGSSLLQHVEWQLVWSDALPWRIFEYQALLALAEAGPTTKSASLQPPVESTVVLLSGREEPWPEWMSYRLSPPGAPFSGVHFRLEAVYLRSVEELCSRGLLWLMFAPLARDATEQKMASAVGQLREQASDQRTLSEVGAAMTALAEADKRKRHLGSALLSLLGREIVMQNSIFQMGKAEGEAKGKAEALLVVLTTRGLGVTDEQRERIVGERDLAVLDRWLGAALTATQTDELWAQPARRSRRKRS